MKKLLFLGLTVALVLGAMPALASSAVLASDPAMVEIDVKPYSCPSSINLNSRGVVPVMVYTTDDFDANTIDPETVVFAGAEPVRWTPEDIWGDGYVDLLLFFKTQDLNLTESSTEATLTGETYGGQPIEGTGSVNIVPKGKK